MSDLITLKAWAEQHGVSGRTARLWVQPGQPLDGIAQKVGRDWIVPHNTPVPAQRLPGPRKGTPRPTRKADSRRTPTLKEST